MQYIIGDLRGAGWTVKTIRENDLISDSDLLHVFRKVDIDNNQEITTSVMTDISNKHSLSSFQELNLACRYLCRQFQIDINTVRNGNMLILPFLHLENASSGTTV